MKVLVLGGTRFLGYFLAWRLIARGHALTLLNRGTHPDPFGFRIQRRTIDRQAPDAFLGLGEFDAIVDFSAYDAPDVAAVAQSFQGKVGHYVFISTGQVYLVREQCPQPSREIDYDGPTCPRPDDPTDAAEWHYGMKKRACEDALVCAFDAHGFSSTRVRLPMVHGPRDYRRRIENYLWRILDGGPILIPALTRDRPMRHVYVESVVDALVQQIESPPPAGTRAYNFAQDETPTLWEWVGMLADRVGSPDRRVAMEDERLLAARLVPKDISPLSDPWMSFIDPTRAKTELSFSHVPLDVALDRIVACFFAHPPSDFPTGYARRDLELRLALGG